MRPPRSLLALRKTVTTSFGLGVHLALVLPACAALESGDYQTLPGATVESSETLLQTGRAPCPRARRCGSFACASSELMPAQSDEYHANALVSESMNFQQ
jgi:hypothetical protein